MANVRINPIVAIGPESEQSADVLLSNLVEKLNNVGLPYLHVGSGDKVAYVVLLSDDDLPKLEEVAVSCRAIVSGLGYLRLENYGSSEEGIESVEQALVQSPIDYDIPIIRGTRNKVLGVCGRCGGVSRHIPPCNGRPQSGTLSKEGL